MLSEDHEEEVNALNYLDEILPNEHEQCEHTHGDTTNICAKKGMSFMHHTRHDDFMANLGGNAVIIDPVEIKKKKLDIVMKEYNLRIERKSSVHVSVSTIEQTKKMKHMNLLKESLNMKLKLKRNEMKLLKNIKNQDNIIVNKGKKGVENNTEFYSRHIKKKIESKNKKIYDRALKFKKIRKQKKKKNKISKNFLKGHNLGYISRNNFINLVDIQDWRILLEKQIHVALDTK